MSLNVLLYVFDILRFHLLCLSLSLSSLALLWWSEEVEEEDEEWYVVVVVVVVVVVPAGRACGAGFAPVMTELGYLRLGILSAPFAP